MLPDSKIIKTYSKNSRDGQIMLLHAYKAHVQGVIACVVNNSQDVEELTQDTFLKVFSSFNKYNPRRGNLAAWIYRIAYNLAQNFVTRQQRFTVAMDDDDLECINISDAELDSELSNAKEQQIQMLEQIIDNLPREERVIITFYYYEDCPIGDIAQILNTTSNAIYLRLQRIRRKLCGMVADYLSESSNL